MTHTDPSNTYIRETSPHHLDLEKERLLRDLTQSNLENVRLRDKLDRLEQQLAGQKASGYDYKSFDALDCLIWVQTCKGVVTFANHFCEQMTGRTRKELEGEGWRSLVHPSDFEGLCAKLGAASKSMSSFTTEFRLLKPDGDYRWIQAQYEVSGEADTRLYVGIGFDVTQQKTAEEQLKLIAEGSGMGFWNLDLSTGDLLVNDVWGHLLGFNVHDTETNLQWWRSLIHPDDREKTLTALRAHIDGKSPSFEHELRMEHRSGYWLWFLVKGRVVEWSTKGHPRRAAGTLMDITERVVMEQEQHRFEIKMQDAQKLESIGVLAGGIAHDFNNLLMGILGNADLALSKCDPGSEATQCLDAIVRASSRAADLCKELLAYSGKGQFIVEPVQLNEVIRDMYHLLDVTINKNVDVDFQLASKLPAIEADATQIRQVIMNLLTNASEAIGSNYGVISVSTRAQFLDQTMLSKMAPAGELSSGHYVLLTIQDNGEGMDAQTRQHIFDPFFTTKAHGRGLGMAAVCGIVRSHHGLIEVESTPNEGSKFTLIFPASELEPIPAERDVLQSHHINGGHILLVEDEPIVANVTTMMLRQAGYTVEVAKNGVDGVRAFTANHQHIDLVVLDLAMPIMNGEEALKRMVAVDHQVKILLTSGYNEQGSIDQFTQNRISGFLQKPYTSERLITEIQRIQSNGAMRLTR